MLHSQNRQTKKIQKHPLSPFEALLKIFNSPESLTQSINARLPRLIGHTRRPTRHDRKPITPCLPRRLSHHLMHIRPSRHQLHPLHPIRRHIILVIHILRHVRLELHTLVLQQPPEIAQHRSEERMLAHRPHDPQTHDVRRVCEEIRYVRERDCDACAADYEHDVWKRVQGDRVAVGSF